MKLIDKLLDGILFVVLAVMTLTVGANVFCRFLLSFSLYWGDELAQILLVWLTFVGGAVASREYAHYAFDYLLNNLSGNVKMIFSLISYLMTIAGIAVLFYYSLIVTIEMANWTMPALGVSRSLVYGACPFGCFFMLIYHGRDLVKYITGIKTEKA